MPLIIPGNSSSAAGFTIDQSIRFNSNDSAYMYRNVDAPAFGNKYTMSFWAKFTNSDDYRRIITFRDKRGNGYPFGFLRLEKSDDSSSFQLTIFEYDTAISSNYPIYVVSAMKFRDYAAWYHIVVSVDYTRPVADRCILYVNGTPQTFSYNANSASSGTPQSQASGSGANYWQIGRLYVLSTYPGDYYLAEIHVVDGNAYGPEFFGETNNSGIWVPKEFEGSHGSGGFFIDGRDSSDLGDDESGNGNDFTTSGLAAHDQVSDTPTNNFPVLNPNYADASGINSITLANGNLQGTGTSGQFDHKTATFNLPKSGKWYFEYYLGGLYTGFGICIVGQEASITGGYGFGALSTSQGFGYQNDSIYNGNAVTTALGLGNRSAGDILNVAVDVDNDKFYLGINNTYVAADGGSDGNPSSGTNPTVTTSFSLSTNDIILGFYLSSSSGSVYLNFGQDGTFAGNKTAGGNSDASGIGNFLYSVPTGFKALCSKNLGS